jgi:hypothetical protein
MAGAPSYMATMWRRTNVYQHAAKHIFFKNSLNAFYTQPVLTFSTRWTFVVLYFQPYYEQFRCDLWQSNEQALLPTMVTNSPRHNHK